MTACKRRFLRLPEPPPVHWELFEALPPPTLTVEQASKTHPHDMAITKSLVTGIDRLGRPRRARRHPHARTIPMSGGD